MVISLAIQSICELCIPAPKANLVSVVCNQNSKRRSPPSCADNRNLVHARILEKQNYSGAHPALTISCRISTPCRLGGARCWNDAARQQVLQSARKSRT